MMIKKLCLSCGRTCWHNSTKEGHRCSFCGHPVGTGPKREAREAIREKQANQRIRTNE